MFEPRIDIPEDELAKRLNDGKFIPYLTGILVLMNDPKEIRAVCVHEAAHLRYMKLAGMRDPIYGRTTVCINPKTGEYDHYSATIQCPHHDPSAVAAMDPNVWVLRLVQVHVAGGVASRVILNISDGGDSGDQDLFEKTTYPMLRKKLPITMSADDLWKLAIDRTLKELESNEVRDEIESLADELEPLLFVESTTNR